MLVICFIGKKEMLLYISINGESIMKISYTYEYETKTRLEKKIMTKINNNQAKAKGLIEYL
jgi:hypothetical protein